MNEVEKNNSNNNKPDDSDKPEEIDKPVTVDVKKLGRVVVMCGSFPPMQCGVGDSAYELARELAGRGVDIEAITDVRADPVEKGSGPFPVHAVISRWGLTGIKKLTHAIDELKPDILHIHYPSKAYGRGLGVPFLPMILGTRHRQYKIVVTLHEFRLSHALRRLAFFILIDPVDAVVMPCPLELDALIKRHISVEEKINDAIPVGPVGPSGESLSENERLEVRKKYRTSLGIDENDIVLLHYGTPTMSKGLEVLFKAMRLLKLEGVTPTLVIAGAFCPGENDFHKTLEGQTRGLGIMDQVKWIGRRPIDELPGIFLSADVGVFPFLDGFSFRRSSLVGVLMWDIPIITTEPFGKVEGIYEQEKIKFVARNDPKALATTIINMIANPMALERAREAANPLKEYFRWDRIAKQYLGIYNEVIQKR